MMQEVCGRTMSSLFKRRSPGIKGALSQSPGGLRNSSPGTNHSLGDDKKEKGNRMAYQKPLGILTSGNTLWNTWRQTYPDVQAFEPDLHGVDLSQRQLRGIDFHAVDLTEADLQLADLREADLRGADLRHANLRGANLSDANLQNAHVRGADLRGAKLCRSNLRGADLSHADLRGADILGADWEKAMLDEARFDEIASGEEKKIHAQDEGEESDERISHERGQEEDCGITNAGSHSPVLTYG